MSKIVPPFVRNPYNYDRSELSDRTGLDCSVDGPGRTQQSFAEEADINTLIRRFGVDGPLPSGVRQPSFGDFTGLGSYQDALHAVRAAEASFMAMPARVRSRFGNDPNTFIEFFDKSENLEEARKLGLVREAPVVVEPKPQRVVVVQPDGTPPVVPPVVVDKA